MTRSRNGDGGADTTVVVATRDRRESLLHTLDRLRELPEAPPVVVVDNGSADGTPQAVRRRHPAVRVIEAGRNLGPAARTVGVRAAATAFVAPSATTTRGGPPARSHARASCSARTRGWA